MIFIVQYLIRYKYNELKCNRFKSWYSRKFAETFSSISGVITPPSILKQHGIQEDHSLIKFTVVDTHNYVSPVSTDIIVTAEEVASSEKTFYSCSKEFETLALRIMDLDGWLYTTSADNAKELHVNIMECIAQI